MSDLLTVNVNAYVEAKNGLSYLSWAWAWSHVLKHDPKAFWKAEDYKAQDGTTWPCMFLPDGSAMVKVFVTINDLTRSCMLPVMNHRNQAIKNPDAFAINTAIMRCLAKAIGMHGLGLYLYAGEDLPPDAEPEPEPEAKPVIAKSFRSSATMGAMEALPEDEREYIVELAAEVAATVAQGQAQAAWERVHSESLDDAQTTALWSLLDSKTRAAIKAAKPAKVAA